LNTSGAKRNIELVKEHELVKAAQLNPEKFSVLYDKYYKAIFGFVYKRLNDTHLTADLTSLVFLKAMLNLKRYRYRGVPFSAWLFRIAINEVYMYYRKKKKIITVPIPEDCIDIVIEDADMKFSESNRRGLVEALNELKPEQAQMIELRFFEQYSFREIGEIYAITEANAKTRVYRILRKMKKTMNLKNNPD